MIRALRILARFDWAGVVRTLAIVAGFVGMGLLYAGLLTGWAAR